MRIWRAIFAAAVLWAAPATGQEQDEVRVYNIRHALFGDIGTLSDTITSEGHLTRVVTHADVKVRILGITLHRFLADWSETWDEETLVEYRAKTTRNGDSTLISGRHEDGAFVVRMDEQTSVSPSDIHPVHPWSLRFVHAATLISPESGRIFPASIVDKGDEWLSIEGRAQFVHHYVVLFDTPHHLYFDDLGTLIFAEYRDITGGVKVTLRSRCDAVATANR